jgi:hypothetical protein
MVGSSLYERGSQSKSIIVGYGSYERGSQTVYIKHNVVSAHGYTIDIASNRQRHKL